MSDKAKFEEEELNIEFIEEAEVDEESDIEEESVISGVDSDDIELPPLELKDEYFAEGSDAETAEEPDDDVQVYSSTDEYDSEEDEEYYDDSDDYYDDDDFFDEFDDEEQDLILQRKRRKFWIILVFVLVVAYVLYSRFKVYTDYRTISSTSRADSAATHFVEFKNNVLKYSNDGASYTDASDVVLWNQGFEMQNPIISVSGDYVMFADREGKSIYLLTEEGLQSSVESSMPIVKAEVSDKGVSAVLMEDAGVSYLAIYNKNGDELAEGAIHIENGGTPLDIALSDDGQKLAVSLMDLTGGVARTTIRFYDFGEYGQGKTDNVVAEYVYEDTVVPDIVFVDNGRMLAFGDNGVYTFSGKGIPQEDEQLVVENEIQTVFYDDSGFGLVFAQGKKNVRRYIEIYDVKCNKKLDIDADISYEDIFFMNNHDICMYNDRDCVIYKQSGRKKFEHTFETNICGVVKGSGYRQYYFLLDGETDRVRLKVF